MFLNAPFALDRNNEGSQVVVILTATIGVARRRVPTLVCFVEMAVAEWRKLLAHLSRAVAGERRHRAAIEHELFHVITGWPQRWMTTCRRCEAMHKRVKKN